MADETSPSQHVPDLRILPPLDVDQIRSQFPDLQGSAEDLLPFVNTYLRWDGTPSEAWFSARKLLARFSEENLEEMARGRSPLPVHLFNCDLRRFEIINPTIILIDFGPDLQDKTAFFRHPKYWWLNWMSTIAYSLVNPGKCLGIQSDPTGQLFTLPEVLKRWKLSRHALKQHVLAEHLIAATIYPDAGLAPASDEIVNNRLHHCLFYIQHVHSFERTHSTDLGFTKAQQIDRLQVLDEGKVAMAANHYPNATRLAEYLSNKSDSVASSYTSKNVAKWLAPLFPDARPGRPKTQS